MELVIDRITKQFQNKIAVDRITTKLQKGVYGLLGANGAGKTTFIRMLSGVLKPTGGEVKYNGIDVSHEDYRDVLGYLPQDFGYYPEFTAAEFMYYLASLKELTKERAKEKTAELLSLVGLSDMAKKRIKTFSGGMKQKLGIAQALLNNPKILILDEPTSGLDPKERIRFRNIISQLGEDRIVLLSTHIVSDIESIARVVMVMKDGQLIQQGSVDDIISVLDNKVFECTLDEQTAQMLIKTCDIINIRREEGKTFLRLVSESSPHERALPVQATLEDLYLYYFSEVNGIA